MSARRAGAIANTAIATAVAVALAGSGTAESAGPLEEIATAGVTPPTSHAAHTKRPPGAVESCSTRSEAISPFAGAFTSRRNLVVGPLAVIGAGGIPHWHRAGSKFPLLVRNGHRVRLELPARSRKEVGLAYGPLPQGLVRLRHTHRVVEFIACRRGERSGSSAEGRPVTFWSGGVLARSPRCIPVLVWIDGAPSPRRVVIRFGVRRCT
jgi:hypothetical protein